MADSALAPARASTGALVFGAIGVVFGDIGTSPLYALKETFAGSHPLPLDRAHILGVLSLVFWSVTCIVSVKYAYYLMRADNKGQGGSLALLALINRAATNRPDIMPMVSTLGIFAAALFYGDSMITPAISVLSAVEGLEVARPELHPFIVPIAAVILFILFVIQRVGTASVGSMFGPVMVSWFIVLAVLGVKNIALQPAVLLAISPRYALAFLYHGGSTAFLALGAIVLAVTGAEALYADMGHFGRLSIRLAWYLLVCPALVLNYFGQGALLLTHPEAIKNPFFHMGPEWAALPLVILATLATVIASQAVISGAFSITQQATQLGYVPRMEIIHTSHQEFGQIYIPFVNWALMVFVLCLVLGFQSSSNLAAAYGVAVTGTMLIDTCLLAIVMTLIWRWGQFKRRTLIGIFLVVDLAFFLANAVKIPLGGWFPLLVGVALFLLMTTWKQGRSVLSERLRRDVVSFEDFAKMLSARIVRVPGVAIFLTGGTEGVPQTLLHNLKHNKVLHETNVLLTVVIADAPYVPAERRVEGRELTDGFRRLILHFGYMETPDIPKTLANASEKVLGFWYQAMNVSYFLGRETLVRAATSGLPLWRAQLFVWMARSAAGAMEFFQLPTNRVIELGTQVDI
jgi:KUP system potassium uptake protein